MKKLTDFFTEVAEPLPLGEKRFKEKHVIKKNDDPNALEGNFTASTFKFVNRGDYHDDMDKLVYESLEDVVPIIQIKLKHDAEFAAHAHAEEIHKKILDEDDKTVVPEGGRSDGDESHDNYKEKTAAEAPKQMIKPEPVEPTDPEGGDSDGDESHDDYKEKTAAEAPYKLQEMNAEELRKFYKRFRKAKLDENCLTAGQLQLEDGSQKDVSDSDANLVSGLLKTLNKANSKKLLDVMKKNGDGYEEVLKFAKNAK